MHPTRTLASTRQALHSPAISRLSAPAYTGHSTPAKGLGLAVESMRRHMTDEGWQIFAGLEHAGYTLAGYNIESYNNTDLREIIPDIMPSTVVVQDKREWDTGRKDFRERNARFHHVELLARRPDLFKLTILKDSHARPDYHRQSAEEMGVNGWIVYYHPTIVSHLAPYVRPEHCIRVYHTLDPTVVPEFSKTRHRACLLSGAVSGVYPLRQRLMREWSELPDTTVMRHPGYHMRGSATPSFLKELNRHRIAICTSSIYGYALRKIIEATACGCIVVTDLPTDEVLPGIDGNLVRISPSMPTKDIAEMITHLYDMYDVDCQRQYAKAAIDFYDYRVAGVRLAHDIESLRQSYAV